MKTKNKKTLKVKVELSQSETANLKSPYYENKNLPNSIAWLGYSGNNLCPDTGQKSYSRPNTI
jgi:hypothetical protein